MIYKKLKLTAFMTLLTALLPFVTFSNEIYTEVILTIKDEKILAFSAHKNHWVSEKN